MSHFKHSLWTQVKHWAWTGAMPQILQISAQREEETKFSPRENWKEGSWKHQTQRTVFRLCHFLSLVIGSGGMAVEEVVTGVAQKLTVAGQAELRRCTAAHVALGLCRGCGVGAEVEGLGQYRL